MLTSPILSMDNNSDENVMKKEENKKNSLQKKEREITLSEALQMEMEEGMIEDTNTKIETNTNVNTNAETGNTDRVVSRNSDPFENLPLANLIDMLRKAEIRYPKTGSNKQELLKIARREGLIPSQKICNDSNHRKYGLLVLVSPFTSIANVVADKVGTWASYLLSDRFSNVER